MKNVEDAPYLFSRPFSKRQENSTQSTPYYPIALYFVLKSHFSYISCTFWGYVNKTDTNMSAVKFPIR